MKSLPDVCVQEDPYTKICSLSYMGNLLMLFAEDKNKISSSSFYGFLELQEGGIYFTFCNGRFGQAVQIYHLH